MLKSIGHHYNVLVSQFRAAIVQKKRSPKWHAVQQDFLEKNPQCEVCGTKKNLQVHHKKPFHLYPELELEESNLITVCMDKKECHLRIAHGSSWRAFSPNVEKYAKILQKDISQFDKIAEESKKTRLDSSEEG